VAGKLTGRRHIAVWIDGVGRFTLDDDEQLWEMSFPKHVLEYRNESEWQSLDPIVRQTIKDEWLATGHTGRIGRGIGKGRSDPLGMRESDVRSVRWRNRTSCR
jgi:hypothetical protein